MPSFARRIIRYHHTRGRHDLPWQQRRTLYRVWVSEIMLQQTQVHTVIPYYQAFMRKFPSLKKLAEAPLDEVLASWSGLGYYARARNLHTAAQQIRADTGRLPRTTEQWMQLPGIGRSTAGAIVSLTLDQPAPMLDGNARRVIARHRGLSPQDHTAVWRAAERLLPQREAAAYTQGLMDLGAQCCTRTPDCTACPLRTDCQYVRCKPEDTPARASARLPRHTRWVVIVQADNGEVLLRQRETRGIWGGLWSLPEHTSLQAARRWVRRRANDRDWREEAALTHRLSHLELHLRPLRLRIRDARRENFRDDGRWFDPNHLTVGVATPIRKLLRAPTAQA